MSVAIPLSSEPPHRPVARTSHTVTLLVILAAFTLAGAMFQKQGAGSASAAPPNTLAIYLPLLLSEWLLFLFVWARGLRPAGTRLRDVVGGRWSAPADVLRDVSLGVAVWAAWWGIESLWVARLGNGSARSIAGFLPHSVLDGVLWVLLSASAGFVEEVVFRGYLQRQFAAWTQRPWLALVLQAIVFGVSHGYQGVSACARITVYALLFGVVAAWRRSLRAGMIAHALTDLLAGLFRL